MCHLPYPAWFPKRDFLNRAQLGNEIAERHDSVPIFSLRRPGFRSVSGLKERLRSDSKAPRFLPAVCFHYCSRLLERAAVVAADCPGIRLLPAKIGLKNGSVHVQSLPVISTSFTAATRFRSERTACADAVKCTYILYGQIK